jgi:hypothetical protein
MKNVFLTIMLFAFVANVQAQLKKVDTKRMILTK